MDGLWLAVSLSLGSSVDNLAVGLSLGAAAAAAASTATAGTASGAGGSVPSIARLNAIVATLNSAGALLSSFVGRVAGAVAPRLAGVAAAIIFG